MTRNRFPCHLMAKRCLRLRDWLFLSILSIQELARPTCGQSLSLVAWLRFISSKICRVPFGYKRAKLSQFYRLDCLQFRVKFGKLVSGPFQLQWKILFWHQRPSWFCLSIRGILRFFQVLHMRISQKALQR